MSGKDFKLYQFPISHYCEKVRWALDYNGIDYQAINLLPGLHAKVCKRLGGTTQVPVLEHGNAIVQGSSKALDYIEQLSEGERLREKDKSLALEVQKWEAYADENIGPHVRRIAYHDLLDRPDIVKPFFKKGGPWYGGIYVAAVYPKLATMMRRFMKINDEQVAKSKEALSDALSSIEKQRHSSDGPYIVGDHFTRADLAYAALTAPFTLVDGYGLEWPDVMPERLQNYVDEIEPLLAHSRYCYEKYR